MPDREMPVSTARQIPAISHNHPSLSGIISQNISQNRICVTDESKACAYSLTIYRRTEAVKTVLGKTGSAAR